MQLELLNRGRARHSKPNYDDAKCECKKKEECKEKKICLTDNDCGEVGFCEDDRTAHWRAKYVS